VAGEEAERKGVQERRWMVPGGLQAPAGGVMKEGREGVRERDREGGRKERGGIRDYMQGAREEEVGVTGEKRIGSIGRKKWEGLRKEERAGGG